MTISRAFWMGALSAALVVAQTPAAKPGGAKPAAAKPPVAAAADDKPASATKSALDKKTMEEWVRHVYLWPPR